VPNRGVIETFLKATEQGRSLRTALWVAAIVLFYRPTAVQSPFYNLPCSIVNPAEYAATISCASVAVVYLVQ